MKNNKFVAIYQDIADQIQSGAIKPGTKLLSEHELGEKYDASRETIRKALNLLSQNGYIQKVRGKGSIVLDVSKLNFPVSGLVSFKELAGKMGKKSRTIVEELHLIKPDDYLRAQLNATTKDEIWKVVRVREIDGEKIILDKDFFNRRWVPSLTKEICEDSIYEYLENELGIQISFAKKEIIVEEPTEEDKKHLDLEGFHNVVIVKNHVYLDDASIFQYTESRHRPDKFRFVDFARRSL
ncbi:trehalose operon repressor [Fictibacillus sp. Mic-4]|uniref:trehalose operon repressor n=1 Tax=Fictibacillus sp. Mic-4 TaxID=3132826 RepID=UPI003CF75E0C